VREKIASLTNPALRLVFAVEKNDVGAIAHELRNGADPNFLTTEGATMLMAAVASGHGEAARALLEGGADPNRVSRFGNTVMELAGNASDADSVVMLLEYGALPSEKLAGRQAQASGNSGEAEDAVRDFATALGDFVWETDAECKLTYLTGGVAGQGDPEKFLGRAPWELPGIDAEEATWTQFCDDISERQPLRAAAYRQEMADGEFRFFEINGAPQFGDDGALIRYRGIGRDITDWFARDEKLNSAWEAERKEYETLLTQQSEKLEKLERASAGKPGGGASAANLKKLLDERADEFQKEQAERKRLESELAAQRDLIEEMVGERTEELQKEVDEGHDEVDKHKRLSGEMAAQCDDLKTLVAAGAAQLKTTTTERDTLQVSVEEVTQSLQKVTGERQSAEARLAEAIQSAKAAAKAHAGALKSETETHATALEGEKEAHASALKGETEKRARVDKELSEARDQFNAQSGQLEEPTVARQCLEEDLAALRAASEKELSETKAALEAAIESKTQFLAAIGQQIQSHLGAGADGTAEPDADAEDQDGDTKVTPLRRARGGK
jgi:PAS domain-containing protein